MLGFAGEGEEEVGFEVAFVDFVEDDRGGAVCHGVCEEPADEDSRGHEFDDGGCAGVGVAADGVADVVAELGSGELREAVGGGAGGYAAWLGHDDPAGWRAGVCSGAAVCGAASATDLTPAGEVVGDGGWHECGFAGSGWGLDDGGTVAGEGGVEFGEGVCEDEPFPDHIQVKQGVRV